MDTQSVITYKLTCDMLKGIYTWEDLNTLKGWV